ncbi:MAG: alpha-L-fucosidase [Actinomycetota bacterium]
MPFTPDWESVKTHAVPDWYHDAKLGVFLHWGPYSVPAWAPQVPDIPTILREHGPKWLLRNNPYAEWYLNTMQFAGSPTERHHRETYGEGYPYDRFAEQFAESSADADLDALADLCRRAGARYVVLTTKHHDGFCLWPSSIEHPAKGRYHSTRDLVGDTTAAVRAAGMRMGLYYSGGFDWPFNDARIAGLADLATGVPQSNEYVAYCETHLRELIERYEPSVLWNDIACPYGLDLAALFADYYNAVPDGVVNDRWTQSKPGGRALTASVRAGGAAVQALWRFVPAKYKQINIAQRVPHVDFRTPEYAQHDEIAEKKWESTRGVGHSFGANRHERAEDIVTATDLVRSFVDIVSKNGNLLIGIGPEPDGTIPGWQAAPLLGLGEWLATNGEAVFGTRPWTIAESKTHDGTQVRFTQRDEQLYATLLETPASRRIEFPGLDAHGVESVDVLGLDETPEWGATGGRVHIELPERLPVSPALVVRLRPTPQPAA